MLSQETVIYLTRVSAQEAPGETTLTEILEAATKRESFSDLLSAMSKAMPIVGRPVDLTSLLFDATAQLLQLQVATPGHNVGDSGDVAALAKIALNLHEALGYIRVVVYNAAEAALL